MSALAEKINPNWVDDSEDVESDATVAAFDPDQPRDLNGKWVDTGKFAGGTKIYKGKYDALSARTPAGDWHFYDVNRKVWESTASSPSIGVSYEKKLANGELSEIYAVEGEQSPVKLPAAQLKTPATPLQTQKSVAAKPQVDTGEFKRLHRSSATALQAQMGSWTATQERALNRYTSDDYQGVNEALRGLRKPTTELTSKIKTLRSAMKPTTQNIVVYRATNPAGIGVSTVEEFRALEGKELVDHGFGSTTINRLKKFPGVVQAEIEVPKGTRGAYVGDVSANPSEDEFVLDADTRYRVISAVADQYGYWRLKLRVVN